MAAQYDNPRPVAVAILATAPGLAATCLAPAPDADGASTLQARLIERAVETAIAAAVGPVTLWVAPDHGRAAFETLSALFGVALAEAPHGDLGARILVAAAPGPAIVIASDCAALASEHLRAAASALGNGVDAVIVAANDGYALIGMQRPEPALFAGMTWSGGGVMAETRRRLTRLGLSWREPARLQEIDVAADRERDARRGLASLMG